jgi:uncharacterized YceG family protein
MMPERDDWEVDREGNLTPPSDLTPDTDEFGRDDPAALERERRRREREARRKGQKPSKPKKRGITGSFGAIGRRKGRDPASEPAAESQPTPPPAAPGGGRPADGPQAAPTRERPAARPAPPADAAPSDAAPADAPPSRRGLRERIVRGREGGGARPPRRGRGGRGGGRRGNYGRRRIAALVLVLLGILAAWFLVAFFQPFAGDGDGDGAVTVEIPEGADAGEIATILDDAGVVSSGRLFEWRLRLADKADDVQADTYTLAENMSYGTAIDRLTGEAQTGAITVTIPEGLDRNQIAADVLPEGVSSDEYLELTETAPKDFNPAQYGAKDRSLEGFLFPATYELQAGQGAPALVQQQLAAFKQNIGQVNMSYAKKKNLTVYDVLIIASMVDKEVQVPKERPLVAAVIYNRLSKGIPLGIDATTRFESQNYTEQIPQSDLEANTPYNTRLNQGLTPTPIGNPGLDAIKAAAAPARVNYLYFVVKPGTCGEHSFTASEQEFEQLAAEYQQALQEQGGSPTNCPE